MVFLDSVKIRFQSREMKCHFRLGAYACGENPRNASHGHVLVVNELRQGAMAMLCYFNQDQDKERRGDEGRIYISTRPVCNLNLNYCTIYEILN